MSVKLFERSIDRRTDSSIDRYFERCICRNSYRFITIYKYTYELKCLESHVNTEINLDLRDSNIPGFSAVEDK